MENAGRSRIPKPVVGFASPVGADGGAAATASRIPGSPAPSSSSSATRIPGLMAAPPAAVEMDAPPAFAEVGARLAGQCAADDMVLHQNGRSLLTSTCTCCCHAGRSACADSCGRRRGHAGRPAYADSCWDRCCGHAGQSACVDGCGRWRRCAAGVAGTGAPSIALETAQGPSTKTTKDPGMWFRLSYLHKFVPVQLLSNTKKYQGGSYCNLHSQAPQVALQPLSQQQDYSDSYQPAAQVPQSCGWCDRCLVGSVVVTPAPLTRLWLTNAGNGARCGARACLAKGRYALQ